MNGHTWQCESTPHAVARREGSVETLKVTQTYWETKYKYGRQLPRHGVRRQELLAEHTASHLIQTVTDIRLNGAGQDAPHHDSHSREQDQPEARCNGYKPHEDPELHAGQGRHVGMLLHVMHGIGAHERFVLLRASVSPT